MKARMIAATLAFIAISGCTSTVVRPPSANIKMDFVCIQENAKVRVSDFLPVLRDGLDRHGIGSKVYSGEVPADCEYTVTYTARQSWDFTTYLSHAEIRIEKAGKQVAYAEYHLNGKGGLALTKWASVKSKMDPVLDEMLATQGR
jgi:hypothetical protein